MEIKGKRIINCSQFSSTMIQIEYKKKHSTNMRNLTVSNIYNRKETKQLQHHQQQHYRNDGDNDDVDVVKYKSRKFYRSFCSCSGICFFFFICSSLIHLLFSYNNMSGLNPTIITWLGMIKTCLFLGFYCCCCQGKTLLPKLQNSCPPFQYFFSVLYKK